MTRAVVVALAAAALAGLAAGYAVAGLGGLVILAIALAVIALLGLRLRLPAPRRRVARRAPAEPGENAAFAAYRHIEYTLGWAALSRRHYDHGVRPLLQRLLAATLADRRGTDRLAAQRAAVGEELWPYLDPTRPPSTDSDAPGVGADTVRQIVERMESL